MSHGFLRWDRDQNGKVRAVCDCGWASHAAFNKPRRPGDQIQALRAHVISGWKP